MVMINANTTGINQRLRQKQLSKPAVIRKNDSEQALFVVQHTWQYRWIKGLFFSLLGLFLLACLLDYSAFDAAWSKSHAAGARHFLGQTGAYVADILLYIMGYCAYILPALCFSMIRFKHKKNKTKENKEHKALNQESIPFFFFALGLFIFVCGLTAFATLIIASKHAIPMGSGGVLGIMVAKKLQTVQMLPWVLSLVLVFLGAVLAWGQFWWRFVALVLFKIKKRALVREQEKEAIVDKKIGSQTASIRNQKVEQGLQFLAEKPEVLVTLPDENTRYAIKPTQETLFDTPYVFPKLELLYDAPSASKSTKHESMAYLSRLIEWKIKELGYVGRVVLAKPGPVLSRFELFLEDDFAGEALLKFSRQLATQIANIRAYVEPFLQEELKAGAEKEVTPNFILFYPNLEKAFIALRPLLASENFQGPSSPLTFAIGVDIEAQPLALDLARAPHVLMTGLHQNMSMLTQSILISLAFKATPQQVKVILISRDTTFCSYQNMPHFLSPVISRYNELRLAFNWCLDEIERRKALFEAVAVKNLAQFNQKLSKLNAVLGGQLTLPTQPLPAIVLLIPELIDLNQNIGASFNVLLQKVLDQSVGLGLHVIAGCQVNEDYLDRKKFMAQFPIRLAFALPSKQDSFKILGQVGAESLLGEQDMMMVMPDQSVERIHGVEITDNDFAAMMDWIEKDCKPNYDEVFRPKLFNSKMIRLSS